MKLRHNFLACFLFLFTCFSNNSFAAETYPVKPPTGFILDEANMLSANDKQVIDNISVKLMEEKRIPIVVVTINSLADYSATLGIESYATNLFNDWKIGFSDNNYGILLLISKNDRKARIEFGKDFDHRYDSEAQKIMNDFIISNFKNGQFSRGIIQGVEALDALARGLPLPKSDNQKIILIVGFILLALTIFVIISLFRSGRTGWGFALLAFLGMAIWYILSSKGGGTSGSDFSGGGSGGGGGATGSW